MEYRILDLEKDVQVQGFDLHSFDVVIAASVLHDTRRVRESLVRLRSLLAPAGALLMIEETKFYPFFDLGMGLQQGFDVFEVSDLRTEHPLLSREQWQSLLRECDFEESVIIQNPGSASDKLGFDVITAHCGAVVAGLPAGELERHLAERLPAYMVPSQIMVLDQIPLTANGKVDRNALPRPENSCASRAKPVAPRSPLEHELVQIIQELLGVEGVGVEDHFFKIGGDSLLASQFVLIIRERLKIGFPMRAIFEAPTVAEIAGLIETIRPVEGDHLFKESSPTASISGVL
jgi:pyochelin synthetase